MRIELADYLLRSLRFGISLLALCLVIGLFCIPSYAATPAHNALKEGYEAFEKGDYEEAIQKFKESLRYSEEIGCHPAIVWNLRNLADVYAVQKNTDQAIEYYDQAIEQDRIYSVGISAELERRKEAVLYTIPCDLRMSCEFNDEKGHSPNGVLDAGEDAMLLVRIVNNGNGKAYGVRLDMQTSNSKVRMDSVSFPGDIPANQRREIQIPVKGDLDLGTGEVSISLLASDRRGFQAKSQLKVITAYLELPRFVIDSVAVEDDPGPTTRGNGNHIIENGETVEVKVRLKNTGEGDAVNPAVTLYSNTPDVEANKSVQKFGRVRPGQTIEGRLIIHALQSLNVRTVSMHMTAMDARGIEVGKGEVQLKADRLAPSVHFTCRVLSKKGAVVGPGNGYIENGEEGRMEVVVTNTGNAPARNVQIGIQADDLFLLQKQVEILSVGLGERVSRSIGFQVPRSLGSEPVHMLVTVRHDGFTEEQRTVVVSHRPFTP